MSQDNKDGKRELDLNKCTCEKPDVITMLGRCNNCYLEAQFPLYRIEPNGSVEKVVEAKWREIAEKLAEALKGCHKCWDTTIEPHPIDTALAEFKKLNGDSDE